MAPINTAPIARNASQTAAGPTMLTTADRMPAAIHIENTLRIEAPTPIAGRATTINRTPAAQANAARNARVPVVVHSMARRTGCFHTISDLQ